MNTPKTDEGILLENISKLHTTTLGVERIKNNTGLSVKKIENLILNRDCIITRIGKNYYCETKDVIITINAHNYCIITAHKKHWQNIDKNIL